MPELPEAETIVRGLRPRIVGRTFGEPRVLHTDVLRVSERTFRERVTGLRVTGVGRRGKNVLIELTGSCRLVVNLGMTGRLVPDARSGTADPPTHPAVEFPLDDGSVLTYDDVRRFGSVECLHDEEWAARDQRMGPEPLADDFTAADLATSLGASRSPVRSWLLDQRRIAGVGNIYAVEALWKAGIHPRRPASSIGPGGARRLHRALREILRDAVRAGGTTIRDYRNVEGGKGEFVRELKAYGREGEPCPRCGEEIVRLVFGNRSSFLCPACQPVTP